MILGLLLATLDNILSIDNLIQIIGILAIMFVWKGKIDEKLRVVETKIDKIEDGQKELQHLSISFAKFERDIEYIRQTDKEQNDKLLLIEKDVKNMRENIHKITGGIEGIRHYLENKDDK